MTQSYTGDYAEAAEKARAKAGRAIDDAKSTAEDLAATAKQKASDAAHAVAEKTGEMAERIQDSTVYTTVAKVTREQPLAAIVVVAGVGFLIGALWKLSRNQSTSERLAAQLSGYVGPHLRSLRKNLWT